MLHTDLFAHVQRVFPRVRTLEAENAQLAQTVRTQAQELVALRELARRHPGAELYAAVKHALHKRGTSFTAWCAKNGVRFPNGRAVVLGGVTGPKADALLARLIVDAELDR